MRPRLAIVPGDPSGIGPELVAKLLVEKGVREAADIVLIGDRHLWQRGADQAGGSIELNTIAEDEIANFEGLAHLDLHTIKPEDVEVAQVTVAGGTTS
jgi:4-hydroxythreonine-4-phosphate dehydrogenase